MRSSQIIRFQGPPLSVREMLDSASMRASGAWALKGTSNKSNMIHNMSTIALGMKSPNSLCRVPATTTLTLVFNHVAGGILRALPSSHLLFKWPQMGSHSSAQTQRTLSSSSKLPAPWPQAFTSGGISCKKKNSAKQFMIPDNHSYSYYLRIFYLGSIWVYLSEDNPKGFTIRGGHHVSPIRKGNQTHDKLLHFSPVLAPEGDEGSPTTQAHPDVSRIEPGWTWDVQMHLFVTPCLLKYYDALYLKLCSAFKIQYSQQPMSMSR